MLQGSDEDLDAEPVFVRGGKVLLDSPHTLQQPYRDVSPGSTVTAYFATSYEFTTKEEMKSIADAERYQKKYKQARLAKEKETRRADEYQKEYQTLSLSLEERLQRLEGEAKESKRDRQEANNKIDGLSKENIQLKAAQEQGKHDLQEANNKIDVLSKDNIQLRAAQEQGKHDLQEANNKIDVLSKDNIQLRAAQKQGDRDIRELKEENIELRAGIAQRDRDIRELKQENLELRAAIAQGDTKALDIIRLRNLLDRVQALLAINAGLALPDARDASLRWREALARAETESREELAEKMLLNSNGIDDATRRLLQCSAAIKLVTESNSKIRTGGNVVANGPVDRDVYVKTIERCAKEQRKGLQALLEFLCSYNV
ncbi:hypothetical protein D9615_008049 [Tricholomella constricta]|uniref:Uncharacterized protein n=1 Tax=Tricholomella constricta TaxID=117010 RepID=A0A8H5LVX1_9AGAR|nr:hypothetical protein D9615_008049 [Tricholomella constricta]